MRSPGVSVVTRVALLPCCQAAGDVFASEIAERVELAQRVRVQGVGPYGLAPSQEKQ